MMVAFIQLEKPNATEKQVVEVPSGQSISDALEWLQIKLPQAAIALVNGQTCDLSYCLQPGDTVRFLLQISGG
jgi:sulfur carrier protein ThiS